MPSDKIAVTYDYNGVTKRGWLTPVAGAGGKAYHLHSIPDSYYCGQLVYSASGWQFSDQKGYHPELAQYFEFCLISWYQ